jgi:tRNA threonylcarbamoyladenosine biosynthesis protein TsaB
LLEIISELFIKSKCDKKSLDFVSYGIGPGSFVGVRLAASVVQAFALSLDIPIVGFSSMFAIAKSTPAKSNKVATVLDARMGDVYLGLYDTNSNETISENVYKLDEYTDDLIFGYELVGESIPALDINIEKDLKIDVSDLVEYVLCEYERQKQHNLLTHETYPVYLRGTSHWKKKDD